VRRNAVVIVIITICHAALSVLALLLSFGMGMSRFDSDVGPSIAEHILDAILVVLYSPVQTVLLASAPGTWFPGLWGYLPTVVNSLVWAVAIVWGVRWWRRARNRDDLTGGSKNTEAPPPTKGGASCWNPPFYRRI
jgi:hypothetical protein